MAEPVLRVEGLGVDDGAVPLLQALSFRLEPAALLAVIGPDEADKDTLVAVLTGRQAVARGTVLLAGRPITHQPPALRVRRGLVATARTDPPPASSLIDATSLAMAAPRPPWQVPLWRRRPDAATRAAALELLDFAGLGDACHRAPADLTPAHQARLRLVLALALAPRVLIVDRLGRGLSAAERAELTALLVRLAAGGIALLWVEDDVDLVGEAADQALVLAQGRLVAGGPVGALAHSRQAELAFLGDDG